MSNPSPAAQKIIDVLNADAELIKAFANSTTLTQVDHDLICEAATEIKNALCSQAV